MWIVRPNTIPHRAYTSFQYLDGTLQAEYGFTGGHKSEDGLQGLITLKNISSSSIGNTWSWPWEYELQTIIVES